MTTYYLTVNGREYGALTPREQEILDAGKWCALAALYPKIEALRDGTTNRTRDWDYFSALDDVLAIIKGSRDV